MDSLSLGAQTSGHTCPTVNLSKISADYAFPAWSPLLAPEDHCVTLWHQGPVNAAALVTEAHLDQITQLPLLLSHLCVCVCVCVCVCACVPACVCACVFVNAFQSGANGFSSGSRKCVMLL